MRNMNEVIQGLQERMGSETTPAQAQWMLQYLSATTEWYWATNDFKEIPQDAWDLGMDMLAVQNKDLIEGLFEETP